MRVLLSCENTCQERFESIWDRIMFFIGVHQRAGEAPVELSIRFRRVQMPQSHLLCHIGVGQSQHDLGESKLARRIRRRTA